jgi:hypothetical protein
VHRRPVQRYPTCTTVEGRLVLHPPIAEPNVASATPGPTLFDIGAITRR